MNRKPFLVSACAAVVSAAAVMGALAVAAPDDAKPAAETKMKLPPGWTDDDIKACMEAATPGKMHEHLAKRVGTWEGKSTSWLGAGSDPVKSECSATYTSLMDGRFIKCEWSGEMPGMGKFSGLGLAGFDNVAQKFTGSWMDSFSTAIMQGTGELSADGKTLTWTYHYHCPISKKPTSMREIETSTGDGTMTLEMYGIDPKSGKEYKSLSVELTKKP